MLRIAVISLSAFQNASSRLTLVLQRPMTTDLLVFRDFCSWRSTVLCSAVRTRKARLSAASAKRNGPDLIGLELRNEKAVLTLDRNCELLDCGRVSFSLVVGFDSPHVLDLPASDDVYGPANSHGRSVIDTSIRANGGVGEHRRAFLAYIRRGPQPRRKLHQRNTCEPITAAKIRRPVVTAICSPSPLFSREALEWDQRTALRERHGLPLWRLRSGPHPPSIKSNIRNFPTPNIAGGTNCLTRGSTHK